MLKVPAAAHLVHLNVDAGAEQSEENLNKLEEILVGGRLKVIH